DAFPVRPARLIGKPATPSAADLASLTARRTRLFRGPFVRSALLVGGASAFARDFSLLLRRHGREPATFLPFPCGSTRCKVNHGSTLSVAVPPHARHMELGRALRADPGRARVWVRPWG